MPDTLIMLWWGCSNIVQPVYFYTTLLTYSAVDRPCNSQNDGLVGIAFKIENLTVQSQDIGQVCQHCTVVYTPMSAGIVMEQQQF